MSERWRTVMVLSISVLFVLLYVGALLGWAGLAPNKEALGYIQPVVWVIIGYYFGRVPGERNESRLKERADKSDAAANAARRAASSAQVRLSAIKARLAAVRSALREGATQTGGEGVLLSGGLAYEVQPRFSPDGKKLVVGTGCDGQPGDQKNGKERKPFNNSSNHLSGEIPADSARAPAKSP